MEPMVKRYLDELNKQLRPLPAEERADAVREIESHIAEGHAAGKPVAALLADLGDPHTLAKAYLSDYYLQQPRSVGSFLLAVSFFATTGFTSLLAVPLLAFFALVFSGLALFMPVALVLRVLQVPGVFILANKPAPIILAIPMAGIGVVLFGLLALGSVKLLRRYFRWVAAGYRVLREGRQAEPHLSR